MFASCCQVTMLHSSRPQSEHLHPSETVSRDELLCIVCFTWASRCARFEFGRKHCWVLCVFCGKWCKRFNEIDFPGKATRNTCKMAKWHTSLHFSGLVCGRFPSLFTKQHTATGCGERKEGGKSPLRKESAQRTKRKRSTNPAPFSFGRSRICCCMEVEI